MAAGSNQALSAGAEVRHAFRLWRVAVFMLLATLAAWAASHAYLLAQAEADFNADADRLAAHATARLNDIADSAAAAAGMVRIAGTVSEPAWADYVDTQALRRRFPGFAALSLAWHVDDADAAAAAARWGPAVRTIRPAGPGPAYLPVVRSAPLPDGHGAPVLGFDLHSDPARAVAVDYARRHGDAALSAKIALRGDAGAGLPAFAVMVPVRAAAGDAMVGVVSAEMEAAAFIESLFVGRGRALSLQVFDGEAGAAPGRLAVRGVDEPGARFSTRRRVAFGGHVWQFAVASTPAYEAAIPWWKAQAMVFAGFIASLLMAVLARQMMSLRARAEQLAETMTRVLREKDARLRQALEGADEGWWDWDAARGGMLASERACEVLGLDASLHPGEVVPMWRSRLHPEDRAAVEAEVRRHVRYDVPFDAQYRVLLPDGVTRWVRTRGKARRNEQGELIGFSGFVSDVTESKLAAQAQAELAARHASALAALPDLVFELDDEGRYVRYHAPNEGDLAAPPSVFLGKRSVDVLPVGVATRIDLACARVRDQGGVEIVEYQLDTQTEHAQAFEGRVVRIDTGGYLCIVRNISDRKAAERELMRHRDNLAELVAEQTIDLMLAKEAAERANRSRADFLATLSHELRTPLHAVLGFADMGLASGVTADKREHCFERIEQSGKRLLLMVSELLDMAKIEAAQGTMLLSPVDWATVCRDVVAECEALLRAKQMAVSFDFGGALCPVRADGPRLQQVVMNLVTNAIKFSPVGGQVVMRLRDCHSDPALGLDQVRLEVEDQGIGLPEGGSDRIFEAFVRGEDAESRAPGSGLGLSICRQYVEIFGGQISAHAAPGGGALFRVVLPCATVSIDTQVAAS